MEKTYYFGIIIRNNIPKIFIVCDKKSIPTKDRISLFSLLGNNPYIPSMKKKALDFYQKNPTYMGDTKYEDIPDDNQINAAFVTNGTIINHMDKQGVHTGLVLNAGESESNILFITSNPYWNEYSRLMTSEEISLFGFSVKDEVQNYFAPVCRLNEDIYKTDLSYPEYRVNNLIIEFSHKFKK